MLWHVQPSILHWSAVELEIPWEAWLIAAAGDRSAAARRGTCAPWHNDRATKYEREARDRTLPDGRWGGRDTMSARIDAQAHREHATTLSALTVCSAELKDRLGTGEAPRTPRCAVPGSCLRVGLQRGDAAPDVQGRTFLRLMKRRLGVRRGDIDAYLEPAR